MSKDFTDFGFKQVPRDKKAGLVQSLFGRVASNYDLMNDLMSFGMHRYWKKTFIQHMCLNQHDRIVDVAGGTGDISLLLHKSLPFLNLKTLLIDLTPSMLDEGRRKAINNGVIKNIAWAAGQAENLPLPNACMDVYTISFGLRNVADRTKALNEAFRVLKPGGRFYCLEFSQTEHVHFQKAYDLYSFSVLPFLGKHVAKDEEAYQYLAESIRKFPVRHVLENEISLTGFSNVKSKAWFQGIVAFHEGFKP
ncbi:MAG: bifunctional demethylmenaquinone methyltransferase/2-methoxy-6-polyprenyl-1,4-benzoquinol methylase UbiE [Candidatus Paracaedibacteraceae bacterium]|nr:bifunctional demethylmenaquinone methyltransferase/2-methoxy-6-polyprenyl-1,4-benzoquinol methylase UbiE [Candidatus Paracaedibacteraceae bacterium]